MTTYAEAIREAMNSPQFFEGVVMTGGYDEHILDHYLEGASEDDREVYVESQTIEHDNGESSESADVLIVRGIDRQGYIESGERLAQVISAEDYQRLGY